MKWRGFEGIISILDCFCSRRQTWSPRSEFVLQVFSCFSQMIGSRTALYWQNSLTWWLHKAFLPVICKDSFAQFSAGAQIITVLYNREIIVVYSSNYKLLLHKLSVPRDMDVSLDNKQSHRERVYPGVILHPILCTLTWECNTLCLASE